MAERRAATRVGGFAEGLFPGFLTVFAACTVRFAAGRPFTVTID